MTSEPVLRPDSWDLSALADLLGSRSQAEADAAWVEALPVVSEQFEPTIWSASHSINPYGHDSHRNLYNVEAQRDFRLWLAAQGVSVEDYADAVGPIQYVSVEFQLLSLSPRARSNRGWRVRAIGFPCLGIVACGLGSNYQGTQNHNDMGRASGLIRATALEVLSGRSREVLERWPAATAAEWEERGLMNEPVTRIGTLDITDFDEGRGAKLRMVRNTTVKKELATFFAIRGFRLDELQTTGAQELLDLRDIALELGRR